FVNMGYEYFSAVTILRSFENIAFVLFIGICSAASVMIGKSIGQGRIERAIVDSKRFSVIVPVLAVLMSVIIVIFRQQLVGIFNMGNNISKLALETAVTLMLIYAVAFPLRMLPYLQIVGIFRSGGDTVTGAKFELLSLWALSVPATAFAVYVLKVPFPVAFAVMYIFEDIPKNIFSIKHFISKKWIKPVTDEGKAGLEKMKQRKEQDDE
ncbi:MAG: MATE family efflux transporter, partial [Eubacterium sp.]